MAQASAVRVTPRRTPARRTRTASSRRRGGAVRHLLLAILTAPLAVRLLLAGLIAVALWWPLNWAYQVVRKPTELFFPVSGALSKTPAQTWRSYSPLFREHSTAIMTPDLLAALAQVEGAGNPVARTYWRWRLSWNPFELYQPASSAVGMYQITDPTFQEAKRYCVHDHVVVEDGPWNDLKSCWFNRAYIRVVPSHAVELTAALLDRTVTRTLERQHIASATLRQRQDLAAIIHLCGAGAGQAYAGRGFRLTPGQKCGDHDVARYLADVNALKRQFLRLAATA
ncbi:MAG: lytic transglycosylase domain-containing protein [Candidatus Rokuibacteriota bacterium]